MQKQSQPHDGSGSSGCLTFLPWCMQRITERIRCQHAELSELSNRSPTHTFAAKYRKFFLKARIYGGDKTNLLLRFRSGRCNVQRRSLDAPQTRCDCASRAAGTTSDSH